MNLLCIKEFTPEPLLYARLPARPHERAQARTPDDA